MPAYTVEFTTREGPQRGQFTIDHDRELGPQVRQVLEELRQRGMVIEGGPADELAVFWNGRELDLDRSASDQEVSPRRELQLRMQPRRREVAPRAPAPPPPAVHATLFPRGAYAALLVGFAGGLLAWTAMLPFRDLNRLIPTYARLDLLAGAILGAAVGASVLGGDAGRRDEHVARGAALGLLLGMLGGAAGAALGWGAAGILQDRASAPYLLQRSVAWILLGAGIGASAGVRWWVSEPRRALDGALHGAGAGLLAGALFSLRGPADFWQALAFGVVGAGVGAGVCAPALRRSLAVLELEALDGRAVGLSRLREWGLREGTRLEIRASRASRADAATVACEGGRCWIAPAMAGASVAVSGRHLDAPAELGSGDVVHLGGARYRFRRLGMGAA